MAQLQKIRSVIFDKNMNRIIRSDPIYESLFVSITTLTALNSLLAKNTMLDQKILSKLKMGGKEYHVCYKCIDLEETFEFHFFLFSDDWIVVNPTGRHDIYDQLTGLLTERSMLSLLKHEIKRTFRNKDVYTALLLDIGHLKDINEMFGYRVGDTILKTVAQTLQSNTRGSDVLGRYKGDKFVVILHKTDMNGAAHYIKKFEAAMHAVKFHFDDLHFHVKINYGLSSSRENETIDSLFERLQGALKQEKENSTSYMEYFT